jgi:hypothetical protein
MLKNLFDDLSELAGCKLEVEPLSVSQFSAVGAFLLRAASLLA